MKNEHRTLIFTIAVLYHLEEKWRGIGSSDSFEDIVTGRRGINLHVAWLKLMREGFLGEFSNEFCFDALYGTSNLNNILKRAQVLCLLVRLDGSNMAYHLDLVSPKVVKRFLRQQKIALELVEKASAELNKLLEEQAKIICPQLSI